MFYQFYLQSHPGPGGDLRCGRQELRPLFVPIVELLRLIQGHGRVQGLREVPREGAVLRFHSKVKPSQVLADVGIHTSG